MQKTPTLVITSGSYTSFAHRILWDAVERHLSLAESHGEDAWILHMSAGLFATAAFEAYLNYLGEEMLPHIWAHERQFFSGSDYKGVRGKFKRISEELGYSLPTTSHRPFAGWLELVGLRDKVVHARPKNSEYKSKHRIDAFPKLPAGWLYAETKPTKIRVLISQTNQLAEELHALVLRSPFNAVVFGSHPFVGLLGFGTRSIEAVS